MARSWTCPRCKAQWPRTIEKCRSESAELGPCSGRRPRPKRPKHQIALDLFPYEVWVQAFGERCGVCGRPPGPNRRLDRDHDHRTGEPRGLLCHRCNRALPNWMTADWLRNALAYLTRDRPDFEELPDAD